MDKEGKVQEGASGCTLCDRTKYLHLRTGAGTTKGPQGPSGSSEHRWQSTASLPAPATTVARTSREGGCRSYCEA